MKKYEYAGIDVSTEKSAADAATCYIEAEKAKDQRTVEIIRDMVIREGDVAVNTLCVLLGIMGEPWKK